MLINRRTLAKHGVWIFLTLLLTLLAGGWYGWAAREAGVLPSGASTVGLTLGIVAGVIMIWEFLLWPRKAMRKHRQGRARTWMRAHIWFGLLCVPLVLLHSGFRFGGTLSTTIAVLFITVIASGIFGLWLQQWIPRRLTDAVPRETIVTAIESISQRNVQEAEVYVFAVSGWTPAPAAGGAAVAHVRTLGAKREPFRAMPPPPLATELAAPLRKAFEVEIRPYLRKGARSGSMLKDAKRSRTYFAALTEELPAGVHEGASVIESWCDERRQLDQQLQLHRLLHSWRGFHLALSIALIGLMFVHIWYALQYMY